MLWYVGWLAEHFPRSLSVLLGKHLLLDHCSGRSAAAVAAVALVASVGSAHATIATRPTTFAVYFRLVLANLAHGVDPPPALLDAKFSERVGPVEVGGGGAIG